MSVSSKEKRRWLDLKKFDDPKKCKAREDTIILPYQKHFSRRVLPKGMQYWTLCGRSAHEKTHEKAGQIVENCEFYQLVKSGFIKPEQFYGVESRPKIAQDNPKAHASAHWLHGDLYKEMNKMHSAGTFRPGIINVDLVSFPKKGSNLVADILVQTASLPHDLMIVANFVLKTRYHDKETPEDVLAQLKRQEGAMKYISASEEWTVMNKAGEMLCYEYDGSGAWKHPMGTVIFFKSAKKGKGIAA